MHSFELMARLEAIAGAPEKADRYAALANKMRHNYIQPIPEGYWSERDGRYVDWIDRQGAAHDHIHLLSNALSVTFGFNDPTRNETVNAVIEQYDDVFQKFPSFVAAKIEDYTQSEIGVGGPYDLCAAGGIGATMQNTGGKRRMQPCSSAVRAGCPSRPGPTILIWASGMI